MLVVGAIGVAAIVASLVGFGHNSPHTTPGAAGASAGTRSTAPAPATDQVTAARADVSQAGTVPASQLLGTLAVKGRAPKTGYSRAAFGAAWTDANNDPGGRNGCDTRNDILRRDLVSVTLKPGSNNCTVDSGTLLDPYTARTVAFTRGANTSDVVQIDHVVALSDAWQKGAQYWPATERVDLANDPLNLLAVNGPTNEAKGDGDAASWLPPNTGYRCAYVARQIAVKARYQLWITAAEHDQMARVLSTCPAALAPTETGSPRPPSPAATTHPRPAATTRAAPASTTASRAAPPPAQSTSSEVYYANCDAVRAAGKAPLLRGQPGYRPALDRDNDGVACES